MRSQLGETSSFPWFEFTLRYGVMTSPSAQGGEHRTTQIRDMAPTQSSNLS